MKLLWDFQRWLEAEKNQLDRSDMHTEMIVSLSDLDTQHQPQSRHFGHHLPLFVSASFFSNAALHTHLSVSSRWIRGGVLIQLGGELLRATNTTHISHTPFTLREFSDRFLTAFWHLQPSKIWDTILCDLKEAWYRRPGGACRLLKVRVTHLKKTEGYNKAPCWFHLLLSVL